MRKRFLDKYEKTYYHNKKKDNQLFIFVILATLFELTIRMKKNQNIKEKHLRIVKSVADIILEDIRSKIYDLDTCLFTDIFLAMEGIQCITPFILVSFETNIKKNSAT